MRHNAIMQKNAEKKKKNAARMIPPSPKPRVGDPGGKNIKAARADFSEHSLCVECMYVRTWKIRC